MMNDFLYALKIINNMNQADIVWIAGWFVAGLFVFQTKGESKRVLSIFSLIFSIISILSLFGEGASVGKVMAYIGISKVTGIFTSLFYLIGANISRYFRFGEMSPRILLYSIFVLVLWITLDSLFW